ncbi:uncharacterized protein K02A2.6-like [Mercenaria mercenaria]|uniref:uncharacterized protein K02A2.6-like n=1 Tax=Mercenaria mercenaria TaxID=6596 RepID=UPI00234ED232|nr:uncharacterized protein K02A2.6-like [Mercenaria mercenaria]
MYVTKLRQKAEHCEFSDKDGEIKSQIIQGCVSKKLRIKCLEEEKELKDILILARSMEMAEKQAHAMDRHDSLPVNKIKKHPSQRRKPENPAYQKEIQKCRNCGGTYPHARKCPALGAKCNYCHKRNHFIGVCRKRLNSKGQLHEISENNNGYETNSEDESCSETDVAFGLSVVKKISNKKVPKVNLKVNGVDVTFLVDTGSSLNILDESLIDKMRPKPKIQKTKTKAYAFGQNKPLSIKGKYVCVIESAPKFATTDFHVVNGASENLISYETAVELEIVPVIQTISSKKEKYSDLNDKYKPVFNGLGKLKDKQIKFHIDESVIPTAQPARRIPFHVRDKVAQELEKLEKLDVIEKATGATPWVSNLVVAPKSKSPNDVRICVDMRKANLALKRERHVVPTVDDIIIELNGSTVFSKVDLYKGFHQLELSEESRNMTVFASHVGLWRYKRLNFGVSVAPEIFQNEIRQVINELNGVLKISDDIIIHGKTQTDHDSNLEALLQRLQDRNLTLNKEKCEFGKSKIKFFGYVFSESGISPDPEKITAIKNVEKPKNQGEVRSFLGMTNYVSRFIENYFTISEPLRRLTQQNQPFEWTTQQENAFHQLKNALVSDKVMAYFDPSKQRTVG